MGKLQHQPRPTLACWTPPTFSPMHSSCSSVGKIFPCVILLSIYIYLYSFTFLKVCGREDEFALLLELGHDIQVSNEIKFLSLWLFFPVEYLPGCLASPMLLAYIASGIYLSCRLGKVFKSIANQRKGFDNYFQIITGCFQATGWPGVVSVMANWFGKVTSPQTTVC